MSSFQAKKASFIRVPKILLDYVTARKLSPEAVLLYSMMLDRVTLSMRNGAEWLDDQGNVFIYFTLGTVMSYLACGHDKARRIIKQLTDNGLIVRESQGIGKPYRIIVHPVADFTHWSMRTNRNEPPDSPAPNNTLSSLPDNNDTDPSILLTSEDIERQIRKNIAYYALLERWPAKDIENIVRLMADTLYPRTKNITISGIKRDYLSVYARLMEIGQMEFTYVLDRLQNDAVQIRSMRAYILTLLFEAPTLSNFYYSTKCNFDEKQSS